MTEFQKHKSKWQNCTLCKLCETRDKVVLLRGRIPADILFIGEAPGPSEDVIGQPFIGPAGNLLNRIIISALAGREIRTAFTNLIACIPVNEDEGKKFAEPPSWAVEKCAPRLAEIVKIVDPSLIVRVGKNAADSFPKSNKKWSTVDIVHPAAILRSDVSQQSLAIKRCVITLSDAIGKL